MNKTSMEVATKSVKFEKLLKASELLKAISYHYRLEILKFDPIFKVEKIDMVDWFNAYRDVDLENAAGQEIESLAYNIGIMANDLPDGKIKF